MSLHYVCPDITSAIDSVRNKLPTIHFFLNHNPAPPVCKQAATVVSMHFSSFAQKHGTSNVYSLDCKSDASPWEVRVLYVPAFLSR